MERIIPNFFINHCKENLEYYRGIFGGEVKNFVYYPDLTEKLMHAELHINENCILFFGDKRQESSPDSNIHTFLKLETEDEIQNVFQALAKEGRVLFELQKSSWGSFHAVVVDKNGITWDLDK